LPRPSPFHARWTSKFDPGRAITSTIGPIPDWGEVRGLANYRIPVIFGGIPRFDLLCNLTTDDPQCKLSLVGIKTHREGVRDVKKFIGYTRVSTKSQGESGLGLEAQNRDIAAHVEREGGQLLKTYREVESGKNNDRPELQKALMHTKRSGATLVVAKLDRLSRNVLFLAQLRDSKVPFVCCDMPNATNLTIGIYAELAQWERERISERTKQGLQSVKEKGRLLGSDRPGHWDGMCKDRPDISREQRRLEGARKGLAEGIKTRRANAKKMHAELCPVVIGYREEGLTLEEIADRLNKDSIFTARGKEWNAIYVHRFLKECA
jgi:DNA invertase Pin-like site-specific DNA recombinase